jgi:hypothetical protein
MKAGTVGSHCSQTYVGRSSEMSGFPEQIRATRQIRGSGRHALYCFHRFHIPLNEENGLRKRVQAKEEGPLFPEVAYAGFFL